MDNRAIEIVRKYIEEHLDKSDPTPTFNGGERKGE